MGKRFGNIENSINTKKIFVVLWLVLLSIFACASIVLVYKVVGNVFFTVFFGITVIFHTIIYGNNYYWYEVGCPKFKIKYNEPIRCEIVDIIGINRPINWVQKTEFLLKSLNDEEYYRLCLEDVLCCNYLTRIKSLEYEGLKYRYYVPTDNYGDVVKVGDVVNVYISSTCDFVFGNRLWEKSSLFFPQLNTDAYLSATTLYGVAELID